MGTIKASGFAGLTGPIRSWLRRQSSDGKQRRFARDRGATAVEMAMVAPFLIVILIGIIDFGSMFLLQYDMTFAAREAARALALGSIDPDQAEQMIRNRLGKWPVTFATSAALPDPADPSEFDVVVTVSVPMADAAPIGFIFDTLHYDGRLDARIVQRKEF